MGNDISSLPVAAEEGMVPPEVLDCIRKGGLTEKQIEQILLEGVDSQTLKQITESTTASSSSEEEEKRHSTGSNPKGRRSRGATNTRKTCGTTKKVHLRRSATDTNVDYYHHQKKKQSPQQMIKLLEQYSTVDTKKADAYFKYLQKQQHASTISHHNDGGDIATSHHKPRISKAA